MDLGKNFIEPDKISLRKIRRTLCYELFLEYHLSSKVYTEDTEFIIQKHLNKLVLQTLSKKNFELNLKEIKRKTFLIFTYLVYILDIQFSRDQILRHLTALLILIISTFLQ